jgi:hypothetical protein
MVEDGGGDGLEDTNSASKKLSKHPSSYTPSFDGVDNTDELHDEVVETLFGSFANKLSKRGALKQPKAQHVR